jgi:hypothetical protein
VTILFLLASCSTIIRPRNETREEKKARKQAIKQERQVSRLTGFIGYTFVFNISVVGSSLGEKGHEKSVLDGEETYG